MVRGRSHTVVACLSLFALVASYLAVDVALAAPVAKRRQCGSLDGTPIIGFNLSCRRAKRLWRGPLPRGWVGANIDVDGGEALIYRRRDENRVHAALGRHGIVRKKLGRAPLVFAHVPYGE